MNIFEKASAWLTSIEFSFTTFVSKVVPWLVPIIPASVTGGHVSETLEFGWLFGWIAGIVVEGLGFASIHTLFVFWQNNKKYQSEINQIPLWIPSLSFIWYLFVVIAVNILLEIDTGASYVRIIAVGALTTLSIPTMAIIAANAIMVERKQERLQKKLSKNTSINNGTSGSNFRSGRPSIHKEKVYELMDSEFENTQKILTFSEIKTILNLPESTTSRLRNDWLKERGLNG